MSEEKYEILESVLREILEVSISDRIPNKPKDWDLLMIDKFKYLLKKLDGKLPQSIEEAYKSCKYLENICKESLSPNESCIKECELELKMLKEKKKCWERYWECEDYECGYYGTCQLNEHRLIAGLEGIKEMREKIKESLDKSLAKQRKDHPRIESNLIDEFIQKLTSLESGVETITEKGTKHIGQYIQIDLLYELRDEYKERLKDIIDAR